MKIILYIFLSINFIPFFCLNFIHKKSLIKKSKNKPSPGCTSFLNSLSDDEKSQHSLVLSNLLFIKQKIDQSKKDSSCARKISHSWIGDHLLADLQADSLKNLIFEDNSLSLFKKEILFVLLLFFSLCLFIN